MAESQNFKERLLLLNGCLVEYGLWSGYLRTTVIGKPKPTPTVVQGARQLLR